MSYKPENAPIGSAGNPDQPTTPEGDDQEVEARVLVDRFGTLVDSYFKSDPNADWVMVGNHSRAIIDIGRDSAMFSATDIAHLEEALGEKLYIFGRSILNEPTDPNRAVPPTR